ncbi:MAG: HAMP domain-containing sensor histidine kinase [Candidatus Fimivivens sp.]|nr:HAMP domain-containing sensor histidine kinase [Candidatus Fimivivens sp.]
MKNKIRLRLTLYFGASFLLFSTIIGVIFFFLFSFYSANVHKAELEKRATNIAATMAGYSQSSMGHGQGMSGQSMSGQGMMMGYGAYLRFIEDIAMSDVWLVDSNMAQITRGHEQASLNYQDLPLGAEEVIKEAFAGQTSFSENFSPLLDTPTITVATPIILNNGTIAGVVLLHSQVDDIANATKSGLLILLFSIAIAIAISFFVAGLLSNRFTMPLYRMKTAAAKISGGDYSAKTGVVQNDEVGELATALDDMASKLAAASLESAKLDQLRRDFVANISHELRTPITVLRGSLEALCEGVVTNPTMVDDYHRHMLSESIHMQRLVSDLLDLARLQSPDLAIEKQSVDLKALTDDVARNIRHVAQGKNVSVHFPCSDERFVVFGDYGRLRQLILILLDNAVKFSPESGVVEVNLSSSQSEVTLSVCDEGPGIEEKDLPYIFERFYKQRSEQNKSGTGLGLAIAKQIAERHNAIIKAKNRPSHGAEFILTIQKWNGAPSQLA